MSTLPASLHHHLAALAEMHPNHAAAPATLRQAEEAVAMAIEAAVLAERQRCATVADDAAKAWDGLDAFERERRMGHEIAVVIRGESLAAYRARTGVHRSP